jgi:hypothetical protein
MFVDNECARYLGRAPLAQEVERYGCRVFSLETQSEFMKYLDEVEAAASREHMELVAEIYGPIPTELPEPPREPKPRSPRGGLSTSCSERASRRGQLVLLTHRCEDFSALFEQQQEGCRKPVPLVRVGGLRGLRRRVSR